MLYMHLIFTTNLSSKYYHHSYFIDADVESHRGYVDNKDDRMNNGEQEGAKGRREREERRQLSIKFLDSE